MFVTYHYRLSECRILLHFVTGKIFYVTFRTFDYYPGQLLKDSKRNVVVLKDSLDLYALCRTPSSHENGRVRPRVRVWETEWSVENIRVTHRLWSDSLPLLCLRFGRSGVECLVYPIVPYPSLIV